MRRQRFFLCVLVLALAPSLRAGADEVDHQVLQVRPVQMGTSGGNLKDRDKLSTSCCSGTLGALVTDGIGNFYILGNNHALARMNKGHKGLRGDEITQPGLIDADCALGPSNAVAKLTTFVILHTGKNVVDAALAQITSSNEVDVTGQILEIGQPSTETVVPTLGSLVMKSGRTTGLTTGTVIAIDGTVAVETSRCNARKSVIRKFINQIIISPNFGSFAQGGDSGSLVLEAAGPCPRPVGLLFAGSSTSTVVNPIDEVLSALSSKLQGTPLSIVGCPPDGLNISSARLVKSKSSGTTASAAAALSFKAAAAAKRNHEARLLSIAGVVGTGIGKHQDDPSQATVEILVEKDSAELRGALPSSVDGIPCHVIETGKFVTF
jgi:hypothetical protein